MKEELAQEQDSSILISALSADLVIVLQRIDNLQKMKS